MRQAFLAVVCSGVLLSADPGLGQPAAEGTIDPVGVTNAVSIPTPPGAFVGIQPCRLVDTRGNGFTGPFGPPALVALTPRVFPVAGYCGIPSTALAVSANLSVVQPVAGGWVSIYPEGATLPSPLVAAITYSLGQTISNAIVAPLGTNGGITLYSKVATHVVIDVNGYYRSASPSGAASCKLVGNVYWCFNPDACGQACNDVCASLGFSVLTSDSDWFAAQDTLGECQAISEAFGLGSTVLVDAWLGGCLEDSIGTNTAPGGLTAPLLCSSFSGCPNTHRAWMDYLGIACGPLSRRSICPCL